MEMGKLFKAGLVVIGLAGGMIGELRAQALVSIDTVAVGNAGNAAADATNAASWGRDYGYGAVGYDYWIGTTEVTISEYTTFLNAVAASDPYGLYDGSMATNLNIAGISQSGISGGFSYSAVGSGARPITYVSWFDAARFSNWLHNGATAGADTEFGAYTLNGATSGIITKNVGAQWYIPSEDEWVKAAYYDPSTGNYTLHANRSDSLTTNTIGSTGGANYADGDFATTQSSSYSSTENYLTDAGAYDTESFYGTFDQGGNVLEWNDAIAGSSRGLRGGYWHNNENRLRASNRGTDTPTVGNSDVGFRVASVPEPSTVLLIMVGLGALLAARLRKATL